MVGPSLIAFEVIVKVGTMDTSYSLGTGGVGVAPGRDRHTFRPGSVSIDYGAEPSGRLRIRSSQGVELPYNTEAGAVGLRYTDLQVAVHPDGFEGRDIVVVYGLRAQMSF